MGIKRLLERVDRGDFKALQGIVQIFQHQLNAVNDGFRGFRGG